MSTAYTVTLLSKVCLSVKGLHVTSRSQCQNGLLTVSRVHVVSKVCWSVRESIRKCAPHGFDLML